MAQKKTVVSTPVVEAAKVEKVKKVGIGSTIIDLILTNPELSNKDILDKVLGQFKEAQTSMACIAWYKSKLRKEGRIGQRVFKKKEKPVEQVKE